MEISTIIIVLILGIGAFQGIVFGIILLRNNGQKKVSNQILAGILFLLSYRLTIQILRLFGLGYYDTWYYFMLDISWLTPALLYFYVKAQVLPDFKIRKKDRIHFLPVIIQIIISEFVRFQNFYWDGTRESLSWLGYWGYVVWMNNSTIYIIASILIIYYASKAQKLLNTIPPNVKFEKDHKKWLKRIVFSFKIYFSIVLFILLLDLIFYRITTEDSYFYFIRFYYYPFFIGLSGLTYWVGLEGFRRRNEIGATIKEMISDDDRKRLIEIDQILEKTMEDDKLYKNPNLSLNKTAEKLNVKPYLLSKSLSEIKKQKFNDYINKIRVDEVRRLISQPENKHYTLLALAMEAGFNSKSSFNRAVKKHLGISPNEIKNLD